jgi:hypothetical protein
VFDSFAGLPEPAEDEKLHMVPSINNISTFEKGDWCGTIEVVTENIRRYGNLSVCRFHEGYFDQTLPHFGEPVVSSQFVLARGLECLCAASLNFVRWIRLGE